MGDYLVFNEDLVSWSVMWQEVIEIDPTMRFHSVFCDPPYLIKFMGRKWDVSDDPISTAEQWGQAILPLLYPGAIVLMFAGTRGWHWLAVGMEKAGFELWDTINWCGIHDPEFQSSNFEWYYATGFPKAQDIGKLIDRKNGDERKVVGTKVGLPGYSLKHQGAGGILAGRADGSLDNAEGECAVTAPASAESAPWSGWKTAALKPSHEPILCFRAPSNGKTYAELATEYGSGCLNVDGCRIGYQSDSDMSIGGRNKPTTSTKSMYGGTVYFESITKAFHAPANIRGRYPANLILDEEAAQQLDQMVGTTKSGKMKAGTKRKNRKGWAGDMPEETNTETIGDSGGASRFFYCAKSSKSEREAGLDDLPTKAFPYPNGAKAAMARGKDYEAADMGVNKVKQRRNTHPTVKPLSLCKYLATLILPPDCVQPRRLLIPFAGTFSEGIGALQAGWDEVYLVEREQEYVEIGEKRIEYWTSKLAEVK